MKEKGRRAASLFSTRGCATGDVCYNIVVDSVKIAAKVNLSLRITGKRGRLHTLDMRVCSVNLFDAVTLITTEEAAKREKEGECVVLGDGKFAFRSVLPEFQPRLFLPRLEHAYTALKDCFGDAEGVFLVDKSIPPCAGMGGSSAAVAAMARLLSERTGIDPSREFLASLGSDVPYMYVGGEARVKGCGEEVEILPFVGRYVVAVYSERGVDTAEAYALYDEGARSDDGENDLFAAACALNPSVARSYGALREAGAERVVMSGSGSAVCAFFDEESEALRTMALLPVEINAELLHTTGGFPHSVRADL